MIALLLEYSESNNEECRVNCLQALLVVLRLGEARVKFHAKTIFEMLIRLLYETSKSIAVKPNETKAHLFDLGSDCLKLSAKYAPDEFKLLCDGMDNLNVNEPFNNAITNIFTILSEQSTNCKS